MDTAKAIAFAKRWENKGSELADTSTFWTEFFQEVLEISDPFSFAEFQKPVLVPGYHNGPELKNLVHPKQGQLQISVKPSKRKSTTKKIDAYIPSSRVIIEQKSKGTNLDEPIAQSDGVKLTPVEQAMRYDNGLRPSEKARFIITCNFEEFRIYDLDHRSSLFPDDDYETIKIDELHKHVQSFDFLVNPHEKIIREKKLSIEAARLMARLRDRLAAQYEQHRMDPSDLAALMVRLLFCLYADDSTLFKHNQFRRYLEDKVPDQQHGTFRDALLSLFRTLNTPSDRRGLISGELAAFPYVNGGLFAGEIEIPFFDEETKAILLDECCPFQWSQISPTLFGSLFESVLSAEERHDGGMHYTAIENIRKITEPLFLDDLELKLRQAGNSQEKLRKLQDRISEIRILDPACGSGNFLTQSYIDLRRLENRILERLVDPKGTGQSALQVDATVSPKVQINHFHGIEINDFAVRVAKTAMQIAKHQMDIETSNILNRKIDTLPLTGNTSIVEANALAVDWNEVLPAANCSFVVGNPPFLGVRKRSKKQTDELKEAFHNSKGCSRADYVAAWFIKAAEYTEGTHVRCAFVSTNSICQGEQAAIIWKPIFDMGVRIDFAYDTFRWTSKADDQAHVFVVIIGFSREGGPKTLFHHARPDAEPVVLYPSNINCYLLDAPDALVWSRKRPLCNAPSIGIGNKPIDGGNYLFKPEEKAAFVETEPGSKWLFHPWMGSREFIEGNERYVLWLGNVDPRTLQAMPKCMKRIEAVKEFRLKSKNADTKKLAETPRRFHVENMPEESSLLVPRISSERRDYVPLGFIESGVFCSDDVFLIPGANLYHFGILHSQLHNAWMRVVCGRLKSDYRYSGGVVYNNFPWPGVDADNSDTPVEECVSERHRHKIEECSRMVLNARAAHPGCTIANLYDPLSMPDDLRSAHKELDKAVEQAYGVNLKGDEKTIVEYLLDLYAEIVKGI